VASENQKKLIVFDVEGVLIPKVRFVLFEVAAKIGPWAFMKAAFYGLLYESGIISLKKALRSLYGLFKGISLERFVSVFQGMPLMPGVITVFRDLKESGFKIALVSSGIPRVALDRMNERLGADYVSGLEIGLSDGLLTGDIWGDVIEPEGKAVALSKILGSGGMPNCYCIGVADDRNNLPLFQLCNLKIGYNPDFILTRKSDRIVKGDLTKILPVVKGEQKEMSSQRIPETSIIRETIHVGGFLVPITCAYLFNRYAIALLISLVTGLYMVSEIRRMLGAGLPIIRDITLKAAERSEFEEFVSSPIFYALGIIMPLIIFPEPIGYVSLTVLTLGDGFATIVGERYGRRHVPFNKVKTLEGSLCGLLPAFMGSLLFITPLRALVASLSGMIAEILPLPLNDNLTIPLVSGLALIGVTWIFL